MVVSYIKLKQNKFLEGPCKAQRVYGLVKGASIQGGSETLFQGGGFKGEKGEKEVLQALEGKLGGAKGENLWADRREA